jgi:hypothetical protein
MLKKCCRMPVLWQWMNAAVLIFDRQSRYDAGLPKLDFGQEKIGTQRLSQNDGMKPAAIYDIENVERRQAHAF